MSQSIEFKSVFLDDTLEENSKYILGIIKGSPHNRMIKKLRDNTSNMSLAHDALSKYTIELGLIIFSIDRSDSIFRFFTQDDFEKIVLFSKEFCENFRTLSELFRDKENSLLRYVNGKLIDGVSSVNGLSAFNFEISLAAFMQLCGFLTDFPEYEKISKGEEGGGICDILAISNDISIAIDAKCVHADTGMMIPKNVFDKISRDFLKNIPENRRELFRNSVVVFDRREYFNNIPGDVAVLVNRASREIEPGGDPVENRYLRISAFCDQSLFNDNVDTDIDDIVNTAIPKAVETQHGRKVENILTNKSVWGKIPVVVSLSRNENLGLLNNDNIYRNLKKSFDRQLKKYEASVIAMHVPDIIDHQEKTLFTGSVEEGRYPQIVTLASRLFESSSFSGLAGIILFGKKFFIKKEENTDQKVFYGIREIAVILNKNHASVDRICLAFDKATMKYLTI
ncbi:hypothetical protein [Acetobacter orleanensis]|uniref:Uncharacterized protein n=1 Tax=Acetobacter orleanensis TaxID=104099 RepID=A0A4Y3TRR4_9PROT|nr:hypothetical protein [Acetobacter orleanensis]KXV66001.1 hypothetical protein AD949_03430 [Acetobacter orleanensis]PCD78511.1 hypothetical protein CO710_11900 [Acetobacter orleanensis]GAN69580.1 hypothetical protein Abol_047_015 [Acetobacter orleanensis JCM 7639]GBR28781.1 hypothetical protein AA0473_1845 [Acetobacter orleanensis NRIC 0473]GEB83700.1 hypothetical protein AOR01nite_21770 [Acetobacter orleanensis]